MHRTVESSEREARGNPDIDRRNGIARIAHVRLRPVLVGNDDGRSCPPIYRITAE